MSAYLVIDVADVCVQHSPRVVIAAWLHVSQRSRDGV